MSYRTTHMGIDFDLVRRVDGGPVDINISSAFVAPVPGWEKAKIGTVYVNGNPVTALEVHEDYDVQALEKLRTTLELDTAIPSTIYNFADLRLRRYESELAEARAALKLARDSLKEITVDPTQFDFGPAYAGAEQRQKDAIKAINKALKNRE